MQSENISILKILHIKIVSFAFVWYLSSSHLSIIPLICHCPPSSPFRNSQKKSMPAKRPCVCDLLPYFSGMDFFWRPVRRVEGDARTSDTIDHAYHAREDDQF
jgi:hypothetical protein